MRDAVTFPAFGYVEWFRTLRHPHETARRLRATRPSRARAAGAWVVSIALSILLTSVAYYSYGFTARNICIYLSAVVSLYAALLALAYLLHCALRIYKLPSRWAESFCLYTLVIAPFAPFVTLVSLPGLHRLMTVPIDRHTTLNAFLKQLWSMATVLDDAPATMVIAALHPFVVVTGLFSLATFIVLISDYYEVDERRAAHAVAFGVAIFAPVIIAPLAVGALMA
jgi:heme/copper-type cytochrome/quinol oxidase subunit 4